ncbi:MAG: SIS domain-containing protein [Propionibacteriaceae bacterium]|nr:SIS domain-containing protein [Propionibacteriaceae bacterium]
MGDILITEIEQQPTAVRATADGLSDQLSAFQAVRELLGSRGSAPVVITGMGSSQDAAEALASRLARRGLATHAVNTAELVRFRLAMLRPGSVVIALSQSGESAELVRLSRELSRLDTVRLVAVTNTPESTLARRAAVSLELNCGPEQGPTTKSIQSMMIVLAVIEELAVTDRSMVEIIDLVQAHAEQLATAIADLLERREAIIGTMRDWLGESCSVWLLGRGQGLAAVETSALVLKEAGHQQAAAMDPAEFRHGPFELAGPDLAVAVVSVEPSVLELDDALLADLADHRTRVLQLGALPPDRPWPSLNLPIRDSLVDASLAVVPFQLLTWSLAVERTPEPGRFVKGGKTTTKE